MPVYGGRLWYGLTVHTVNGSPKLSNPPRFDRKNKNKLNVRQRPRPARVPTMPLILHGLPTMYEELYAA